ncbi:LytTR family DNA-binding domain-containing protein [uncultured Alteromonas sp.]|jgi:hypothetical protein|uniref:LytR/AlgR family response regulator transcription factor n=1 Tax=uncultured Alteromonas sp. TaxID=179113 RepID=UPI002600600D|nr:LytTR family DNA-binding domain-containing protein [uncultured Alteromonas sp.]
MEEMQSDSIVMRFIGTPSAEVDAFHQFLSQHIVAPFEFTFTADLNEAALNELIASHPSMTSGTSCQPPEIQIVVTDQTTIKPFLETGFRGVTSVMCGHSNQDALQAFNAGVGMFFCLSASLEEKRKQLHRLYLKYQTRIQAMKWHLVTEQLARQRACSPARLMAELSDVKSNCSRPTQQIAMRCGVDWQYVDWQTIRYVEAAGDYMCVYTQEETLIVRSTLTEMARRLPQHAFTRVNRSIIVNTQFVKRLIKLNSRVNYVELQDGSKVKISRRLMPVCHQQLDAALSQS